MLGKHKLIFLISAMLLIPILLGMTPLSMAHRLASGGPFTHCKQVQLSNHCLFHSVTSHDDSTIVNLNLTPLDQELTSTFDIQTLDDPDSIHSNIFFNPVPLRC
jgi:hypothetical protein